MIAPCKRTAPIDTAVLRMLKGVRPHLTGQQYRTLRGQVLSGDPDGARRGLCRLLHMEDRHEHKPH